MAYRFLPKPFCRGLNSKSLTVRLSFRSGDLHPRPRQVGIRACAGCLRAPPRPRVRRLVVERSKAIHPHERLEAQEIARRADIIVRPIDQWQRDRRFPGDRNHLGVMDLHAAGHSGLCEVRAQPCRAGAAVRPVSSAPSWPVCGSGVHEHLRRACVDGAGEHQMARLRWLPIFLLFPSPHSRQRLSIIEDDVLWDARSDSSATAIMDIILSGTLSAGPDTSGFSAAMPTPRTNPEQQPASRRAASCA